VGNKSSIFGREAQGRLPLNSVDKRDRQSILNNMPESPLRLIKRFAEFEPKEKIDLVPRKRRGLYVLYCLKPIDGKDHFDVVYVGMTTSGMRGRLFKHAKSKRKGNLWTHFSAYEVWDNIRDKEIIELEGLFRHIYRKDSAANALNIQRRFKTITKVQESLDRWT
jgi:hypothetical protein